MITTRAVNGTKMWVIATMFGVAWSMAAIALAQPVQRPYVLIDLGTVAGDETLPGGINDKGVAVGSYNVTRLEWHSFRWRHGVIRDLFPSRASSFAFDINNANQVTGTMGPAYLWKKKDGLIDIGHAPARGLAVNQFGQVAGWSTEQGPEASASFLWNGTSFRFIVGAWSRAFDVNKHGQVVGITASPGRGFLWANGRRTVLEPLPGDTESWANAINDRGQAVGFSRGSGPVATVIWEAGRMRELPVPEGYALVQPRDINEVGQVVGQMRTPDRKDHAFLWDDGILVDLHESVVNSCGEVVIQEAVDINESGQVLVEGDVDGFSRALLLNPGPLACGDIERFEVTCGRRGRITVKVRSGLVGGTVLPIRETEPGCQKIVVNKHGNGKLLWPVRGGAHTLCLPACDGLCREVVCE